jgi:hypothetical protein
MDNLKRLSVVACATAVGVAFAAGSATAGIIVDTMDGNAFSPRDTAFSNAPTGERTALIQGFSITDSSVLNTAAIRGFSVGSDITIAIAQTVGPGAAPSDILFEQDFATVANGVGTSIHTFDLGALALSPGDYFFVLMSNDQVGFEWSKISRTDSININDRGAATFLSSSNWYEQSFVFETEEVAQVFILEIDGATVPSPGAAALLLGVFAGLPTRRHRRRG